MNIARIERLRAEFDRTSFAWSMYAATLLGSVIGPAIILSAVTIGIFWIGRWSRPTAIGLCLFVLLGTLSSFIEVAQVARLRAARSPYDDIAGWNGVLFASIVMAVLFAVALASLYFHFFQNAPG